MTAEPDRAAARALARHDAFEREDDAFSVQTTPFDATVRVSPAGSRARYDVTVRAPTLRAAVRGETVAEIVQSGWFETLELRLEDVTGVTLARADRPAVRIDEATDEVVVETSFETENPDHGAEDAKALVGFVEGTYLQGVIPGYDYREPVVGMLDRAHAAARSEDR